MANRPGKGPGGSPPKVCLIAIALHWPLQVTLFRSQGLHGHGPIRVLPCTFSRSQKIGYTRNKILQRWQQLTRHRVAMAVRGNLYGTKIYRQEIASVFGFVLRSAYPISGLFGFFFQPEQCFSLTTFQPEQCFSAKFQQAERGLFKKNIRSLAFGRMRGHVCKIHPCNECKYNQAA